MNTLAQFWPKAAADKKEETAGDGTLTILRDEVGQKLANKIYKQFCSENDFSDFHAFIQDFDDLLDKYRKSDSPITVEEVKKFNEDMQGEKEDKTGMADKDKKDDEEDDDDDDDKKPPKKDKKEESSVQLDPIARLRQLITAAKTVPISELSDEQLQTVARNAGLARKKMTNIVESEKLTPQQRKTLEKALQEAGITGANVDGGYISAVRGKKK